MPIYKDVAIDKLLKSGGRFCNQKRITNFVLMALNDNGQSENCDRTVCEAPLDVKEGNMLSWSSNIE